MAYTKRLAYRHLPSKGFSAGTSLTCSANQTAMPVWRTPLVKAHVSSCVHRSIRPGDPRESFVVTVVTITIGGMTGNRANAGQPGQYTVLLCVRLNGGRKR
jgi:hypothetical protein